MKGKQQPVILILILNSNVVYDAINAQNAR